MFLPRSHEEAVRDVESMIVYWSGMIEWYLSRGAVSGVHWALKIAQDGLTKSEEELRSLNSEVTI